MTTPRQGGRGRPGGRLAGLALSLALGGCAFLTPPAPPPTTYDLLPRERPAPRVRATGATIVVVEPTALSALNSERIVARPSPALITYFGGAQWSDRLPALVQARTIQTFEDATWLKSVGRPSDALAADYRLLIDIRAFGVDVGAKPPLASVEMAAKLVNDRTGRIVAARIFHADAPAGSTEAPAGVAALDTALGQVLAEMVAWAGRAHLAGTSPNSEIREPPAETSLK